MPDPDEVILEERWASGEWFRSGAIWKIGHGRIFYFRPGHETFPIFKQPIPLKILTNAVRWLASGAGSDAGLIGSGTSTRKAASQPPNQKGGGDQREHCGDGQREVQ